jgi:hypothetical protein
MRFAQVIFRIAAVYGIIALFPLYFLIGEIGREAPPIITHPEFYYGFIGVGLTWQLLFWIVSNDPTRYRSVMLLAVAEKVAYTIPVLLLYLHRELATKIFAPSLVDAVFAVLFAVAYTRLRKIPLIDS